MFAFFIPSESMNSLTASGFIPLSRRDCIDHVRGSLCPTYSPDRIFFALPDFDIFTPDISSCPL